MAMRRKSTSLLLLTSPHLPTQRLTDVRVPQHCMLAKVTMHPLSQEHCHFYGPNYEALATINKDSLTFPFLESCL